LSRFQNSEEGPDFAHRPRHLNPTVMNTKGDFHPPIVVEGAAATHKTRNGLKYGLIAFASIFIVLTIVAGFVSAFYFMQKTVALESKNLSYTSDGEKVTETVDKYDGHVYRHDVHDEEESYSVVEDFGRRILTIRKEGLEFPHCEVLPMSHDDADYDFDEDIDIGENATKKSSYVLDDQLVTDHGVMGSVAKEMCDGYPLYWGIPTMSHEETSRAKRDIHCTGCVRYSCGCCTACYRCRECHRH